MANQGSDVWHLQWTTGDGSLHGQWYDDSGSPAGWGSKGERPGSGWKGKGGGPGGGPGGSGGSGSWGGGKAPASGKWKGGGGGRGKGKAGKPIAWDSEVKCMPIAGLEEYPFELQRYKNWHRQEERRKQAALQGARGVLEHKRADKRDRDNVKKTIQKYAICSSVGINDPVRAAALVAALCNVKEEHDWHAYAVAFAASESGAAGSCAAPPDPGFASKARGDSTASEEVDWRIGSVPTSSPDSGSPSLPLHGNRTTEELHTDARRFLMMNRVLYAWNCWMAGQCLMRADTDVQYRFQPEAYPQSNERWQFLQWSRPPEDQMVWTLGFEPPLQDVPQGRRHYIEVYAVGKRAWIDPRYILLDVAYDQAEAYFYRHDEKASWCFLPPRWA